MYICVYSILHTIMHAQMCVGRRGWKRKTELRRGIVNWAVWTLTMRPPATSPVRAMDAPPPGVTLRAPRPPSLQVVFHFSFFLSVTRMGFVHVHVHVHVCASPPLSLSRSSAWGNCHVCCMHYSCLYGTAPCVHFPCTSNTLLCPLSLCLHFLATCTLPRSHVGPLFAIRQWRARYHRAHQHVCFVLASCNVVF